jgi:ribosome maturation factor RimP
MGAARPFFIGRVRRRGVVSVAIAQLQKERTLQREVARLVEGALPGVDVLALELTGKERFCVFVDHAQGVDHALCERVTSVLRPYLEEYTVEVSSPGPDRPLRTRDHFERAVGHTVRVKTETSRARGEVVSAGAKAVQIANAGGPVDIPYEQIVRANLIDEGK